jgi:gluconolactonase
LLGIIEIPEHPANVTFGGEGLSTLYVTARNGLYAVPTRAKGHVFPGAVE